MHFRTIKFCLKQGFVNIKRNKLFSLASIGTIAACVFLISVIMAIIINVNNMETYVEQKVGITIFFDYGISQEQIDTIGNKIKGSSMVKNYTFTTAEEAWNEFKENFKDQPELAEGFKDDNPLANSASYKVFLKNIENQPKFVKMMQETEGVRTVKYSSTTKSFLTTIGKMLGYASTALIIILLGVGIFLINNMVMIGISVRRNEIHIMKLIGATNWFVRAPFVLEGVVIGVVGSLIPLGIMRVAYGRIIHTVMSKFGMMGSNLPFASNTEIFKVLLPLGLGIGAGIGLIGSALSLRKHLRV
ncbi:MAG: permease-like cell division protein FtsX [Eubacterium sp.]|nr:permease-like cell division protein FtsX [Eubacterium sp.]